MNASRSRSPLASSARAMDEDVSVAVGAARVLVASTGLLLVAYGLVAQMTELWHFYAANVLVGLIVTGFGDVVVGSVVAKWVATARGMALRPRTE